MLDAGGDVACLDVLPSPSEIEWSGITKVAKETGRQATYYQCDITSENDVETTLAKAAEQANDRAMPIRGLISCAGIQQMTDAIDYPIDGFRKILEVNVTGSFLVAKHTARIMKNNNQEGSIVFIASMSGQIANRVSQTFRPPHSEIEVRYWVGRLIAALCLGCARQIRYFHARKQMLHLAKTCIPSP